MQRVLDLDLDLFVHGVEHFRSSDDDRLDPDDYRPWSVDEAIAFLTENCGLRARLPGAVVEHHGELFGKWRAAIAGGHLRAPFEVTHADAHADLGLGDAGYMYLMSELLYSPPEERLHPNGGTLGREYGLEDGNYLIFALACRWLARLTYVMNDETPRDIMPLVMQGFDPDASSLQLAAVPVDDLRALVPRVDQLVPDFVEPAVPFQKMRWQEFHAEHPFDAVCLARSPGFTPEGCDAIFDEIRARFIDENA